MHETEYIRTDTVLYFKCEIYITAIWFDIRALQFTIEYTYVQIYTIYTIP